MNRWMTIFLFLLTSLCLSTLVTAETVEETVKRQIAFQPGGDFILTNINGRIVVEGWDKDEVFIEAVKEVRAGSRSKAERFMEELEIEIDESSGRIKVETLTPRRGGGFWSWISGNNINFSVKYKVYVPHNTHLDLRSTNGAVTIREVNGDLEMRSTNGRIIAEEVGGEVEGHTTNGSIEVDMARFEDVEELEFTTTNGGIKLYLPAKSGFELRANTTNGSVRTDFPLKMLGKRSRKSVRGDVNGGGPLVFMETTNGSIDIRER